jgi:hypothetical protein
MPEDRAKQKSDWIRFVDHGIIGNRHHEMPPGLQVSSVPTPQPVEQ